MGLLPQAHREAAAPSSGVHPALQAWQGEASRCREADGQLLGAEGDHTGHESGRGSRSFARRELARWLLLVDLGVVPPAVHGALVDDEVGHQKLAMARHQQALRLQLVVLELLAELHEGPALQVHELVLSVRRALAGVQGLVASEGRVELDEMALELLQRQRQGENSSGKLPGSHGSPRRGPGRVRDGVQPGHAAIRGRAQPPA